MTIVKKKIPIQSPVKVHAVSQLPQIMAALIYGRSGTGKTTLASTFPKPILLLDVREKGWDSVSNVPDLDIAEIESWEEFEAMYWYLSENLTKYKTIIIDQVSQLQDLALLKALKDQGKEPTDNPSQRTFGQAAGLMKTWLLNYRDLIDRDIHIAFLAHDRTTEGEEGEDDQIDPSVGPRLMPSVASHLCGAVKVIGNTFIRETTEIEDKRKVRKISYALRIGPHSFFVTKSRTPVGSYLPRIIVDPTYDKVAAVMQGTFSERAATVRKKVR